MPDDVRCLGDSDVHVQASFSLVTRLTGWSGCDVVAQTPFVDAEMYSYIRRLQSASETLAVSAPRSIGVSFLRDSVTAQAHAMCRTYPIRHRIHFKPAQAPAAGQGYDESEDEIEVLQPKRRTSCREICDIFPAVTCSDSRDSNTPTRDRAQNSDHSDQARQRSARRCARRPEGATASLARSMCHQASAPILYFAWLPSQLFVENNWLVRRARRACASPIRAVPIPHRARR